MATTTTGTDNQDNFISCSNGVWSIGSGGKAPQSLNGCPTPPIFDAAKAPIPLNPTNPAANEDYDAILKVGDGANVTISAGAVVAQGHEDALNLNNHATVTLSGADLSLGGASGIRVVTVKGGSNLSSTAPVVIHQHGTQSDVQLNAWSDQSYDPGTADLTNWSMADGSKIKVRSRSFGSGVKLGTNGKLDYLGCVEDFVYYWFKYVVRLCYRLKVGQSGPSWLS
jgi:hypothetical protein